MTSSKLSICLSALLGFSLWVPFSLGATEIELGVGTNPYLGWTKKSIEIKTDALGTSSVVLANERTNRPPDLFFGFETDSEFEAKTNSPFAIIESKFLTVTGGTEFGTKSAEFRGNGDGIRISPSPHWNLNHGPISQDWFLSFRISPKEIEWDSQLLRRSLIRGGKRYGLEIKIENKQIVLIADNIFQDKSGRTASGRIRSPLSRDKDWFHFVLTIDSKNQTILLFEGERELGKITPPSSSENDTYWLSFHPDDKGDLFLFPSFKGRVDEIVFSRSAPDFEYLSSKFPRAKYEEETKFAEQSFGELTSPVYATKFSSSQIVTYHARTKVPKDTKLEVFFRTSPFSFSQDNTEIPWVFWPNPKEIPPPNLPFRYHQWRIRLRSDFSGKITPRFYSLKVIYNETLPPTAPKGFQIADAKTSILSSYDTQFLQVCFQWVSNPEMDVREGGGYKLHYGLNPDRMVATIETDLEGNRITGVPKGSNLKESFTKLGFCVNNAVIQTNATATKDRNLLTFRPGLTYYFKLSATNRYYNPTNGRDQESNLTSPVSVSFDTVPNP